MKRSAHVRALIAIVTATAMISAFGVGFTQTASAATPDETAAVAALKGALTAGGGALPFFDGLTGVGAFDTAAPGLALVPSDSRALGATPLAEALAALPGYATADTPTALASALTGSVTLPDAGPADPRKAVWTTSYDKVGDVDRLTVDVVVSRKDVSTGIRLHSTSQPVDFSSTKGVLAQPSLHVAFTIERSGVASAVVGAPTFTLSTDATLTDPTAVDASLGILGVTLTPTGNSWTVAGSRISGAVRDPDNNGRLTLGTTGELGAAGAPSGLGTVTVAKTGTLTGVLHIVPRAAGSLLTGPPFTQIDISASANPDLSVDPTAVYAANALTPVAAFQRLTPFDLAQGVAQLSVLLDTVEHSRPASSVVDVDLPLLHGSLADLVPANEALQEFLVEHVTPAKDSTHPSTPSFASVQDFLTALTQTDGPADGPAADPYNGSHVYDVTVPTVSYNDTDPLKPRVAFTVHVERAASTQATDPLDAILSAGPTGVSYTGTTITTPYDFGAVKDQSPIERSLVGRTVQAGSSTAAIAEVKDHTITLDPTPLGLAVGAASYWKGPIPSGVPYTIEAGDAKNGTVELNDLLAAGGGIKGANAQRPQAVTTSAYSVDLPLVLDLQAPRTGAACGTPACPYQVKDANGIASVVQELPERPDRFQLDTDAADALLKASSKATSKVAVRAPVGFVPVDLGGDVTVCPASGSCNAADLAEVMTVGLKAQGRKSLGSLINALRTPAGADTVLTGRPSGAVVKGSADLDLSVVRNPGFFGADPGSAAITLTSPGGTAAVTGTDLARLKALDVDPGNPDRLFDVLQADLQSLSTSLRTAPTSGGLGDQVPVLGTTLGQAMAADPVVTDPGTTYVKQGDLIVLKRTGAAFDAASVIGRRISIGGSPFVVNSLHRTNTAAPADPPVYDSDALDIQATTDTAKPADGTPYSLVDELTWTLDRFAAAPPKDLDEMLGQLEQALGAGSHVTFTVPSGSPTSLSLRVQWSRAFDTSTRLGQHLSLPLSGEVDLTGSDTAGRIPVAQTTTTDATLVVPLDAPGVADPVGSLKIEPTSSRATTLKATADLDPLAASVGSLALDLGKDPSPKPVVLADVGASAAGAAGPAVLLSAWQGALTTTMSGTSKDCGSGASGRVCATLPVFQHNGAAALDTITVASATGAGTPTVGGTGLLDGALKGSVIELGPLGAGLQTYLDTAKTGLDKAVAGGKVPLVGKDLQEGSDFLGKLKSAVGTALPATQGSFGTAKDIEDAVKAAFNTSGINDLKVLQGPVSVGTTCDAVLEAPGAPGVTAAAGATDPKSTYTYQVVAQATGGFRSVVSASSAGVPNNKKLDATHKNAVTWSGVPYADSYALFRSTDGTNYHLVRDDITGTSADDTGQGTDAAGVSTAAGPQAANNNLGERPCAPAAPAKTVKSLKLGVTLGAGDVGDKGQCTDLPSSPCLAKVGIPIDLGLPGISLKADKAGDGSTTDSDKVQVALGWQLKLAVVLDKTKGLLVDTKPTDPPELRVGASVTLPTSMTARVAFIKATIGKVGTDPDLDATFSVDLACVAACADGMLPITSLLSGGAKLTPTIKGDIAINETIDTTIDTALPGISGSFQFKATWGNDKGPLAFDADKLGFYDITITPGTMLQTVLGPVIAQVTSALKPIQPIIDTITAPIPVLSDLSKLAGGDDVTLITLTKAFGDGADSVDTVIKVLKTVIAINTALKAASTGAGYKLGSIELKADEAKSTEASSAAADSLTKQVLDTAGVVQTALDSALGELNSHLSSPLLKTAAETATAKGGLTFPAFEHPEQLLKLLIGKDVELAHFDSGTLGIGFTFSQKFGPVYAPPPVLITISGSASVQFRIVAGFDTYGIRQAVERGKVDAKVLDSLYFVTTDPATGKPIPVIRFSGELAAGAEVSVAFLAVGVQGGLRLTVDFTWNDPNNDGKFRFSEFLATALNNPLCLFNVGGRLSLFLKVYITIGFSPFDVTFDFTLADITLLDFSLKPNCTPPPPKLGGVVGTTLYLFAGDLGGDDPRGAPWGVTGDETWVVRQHDDTLTVQALGLSEVFAGPIDTVVLDAHGNSVDEKVTALFQGKEKSDHFTKKVVFFGGAAGDVVKTDVGPALLDGGPGDDSLTTGDRPLLSQPIADAPAVTVVGGGGTDRITVGNAKDVVAGDGSLSHAVNAAPTTFRRALDEDGVQLPDLASPGAKTLKADEVAVASLDAPPATPGGTADDAKKLYEAGNDVLALGLGGGSAYGGPGDDTISVAQDSPLIGTAGQVGDAAPYRDAGAFLYGGTGADRLSGGAGPDRIFTSSDPGLDAAHPALLQDQAGPDDTPNGGRPNVVDTGTGNDIVVGSLQVDLVTGHSKPGEKDVLLGLGGRDVLTGGDGTDEVYGGQGDDYLVSQPADVDLDPLHAVTDVLGAGAHPVTVKPDTNPANSKLLVGGGGSDRIYGGDGPTTTFGDHVAVACAQAGSNRSDGPDEDTSGYTGDNADQADLIYGGAGKDTIQAGGGDDYAYAKGESDTVCGMRGNDHLYGGDAADTIWGGRDNDVVQGDGGNDLLYGNENIDAIYGNLGTDVIEGNDGVDSLFGGQDADTIIGGTSAAGRKDVGDYLYGDQGADVLIGDNGDPTASAGPSFDLADLTGVFGGNDVMAGGDDADHAYGGVGNDTVDGNLGDDHLEGGPGTDTVHGNDGSDDLIGGSSQLPSGSPTDKNVSGYPDADDSVFGDLGDDVILGDNGQLLDTATLAAGAPVAQERGMLLGRTITPYDLGDSPVAATSGGDRLNGGDEPDLVFGQGGVDTIHGNNGDDYAEGGPDADVLFGDAGMDDLVGGSMFVDSGTGASRSGQPDAGDQISGGDSGDVALGDNGSILRVGTPSPITLGRLTLARAVQPYDLGDSPSALHHGADLVLGNTGDDTLLGQSSDDVLQGGAGDDYAEGGAGTDRVEGNAGDDDLVGGSSTPFSGTGDSTAGQLDAADLVFGGAGDDVALGDNALVTRVAPYDPRTFRVGSTGHVFTRRAITAFDLRNGDLLTAPSRAVFGADQVSGGIGFDLLLGQDGNDVLAGEAGDDYVEGNGGDETISGDRLLADVVAVPLTSISWQARTDEDLGEAAAPEGQDDLIGGSTLQGFRDGKDTVHGDGGADYVLGDNGQVVRDILDAASNPVVEATVLTDPGSYPLTNRVYAKRYPAALPVGAAYVRHGVTPTSPTRFCTNDLSTCEKPKAFDADTLFGDSGDDTVYGQDGDDVIWGGDGNDDLYGELGADRIDGGNGDDAILGDRGGIVDVYQNGSNAFPIDFSQVPKIHYDAYQAGTVTRRVDLQHDVNGDVFLGTSTSAAMPQRGDTKGGNDRIRGRAGKDAIHSGTGDDLINGDSGGDTVYGDDGADVMWGGKGSDDAASPNDRGVGDSFVDYLFGGKGGDPKATKDNVAGADIIDWRPRGAYGTPGASTCSATAIPADITAKGKTVGSVDPCSWFEMTDMTTPGVEGQHHQGIDWIYGGWDRDILQGDVADNGPNPGDRLLDWNGAFNLYSHCNAAYGGFNDVRQHSPAMQSFLQKFAWTTGAGQLDTDAVSGTTTSAFGELALAYPGTDNDHASGSAFPSTPGHFDDPNACTS